jgi:hypothetical protein
VAPADPRRGDARAVARGDDAGAGDQEHADPRSTTAFQVVGAQATDPKPHEIDGDDTRSTPQFPSQPAGVVGREDGGPGAAQIVFPDAAPNSAAPHPEDFPHSGPNSAAIGPLSAVGGAGAQHVGQGQQGGSQGNGGHSAGSSHGGDH